MVLLLICLLVLPTVSRAATITVAPGQALQAALDRAQAGDTVQLAAGRYEGPVTMPRDGVTLQGSGQTTLDCSQATRGWTSAGSGIWRAQLGYEPATMTIGGKTIWRIHPEMMAQGHQALARPATATTNTAFGPVQFWDGIEGLFATEGGTTLVRLRGGESPASRDARAAPDRACVTMRGRTGVTIRQLTIVGGTYGVYIGGGSDRVTVEQTVITNGVRRIWVDGATNTRILRNTLRLEGLGTERFPPGDRDRSSYGRIVNRHQYDQNKFLVGRSDTNDVSIMVARSSHRTHNTVIQGNDIGYGMLGMQISQVTSQTIIQDNRIHHMSDTGVYIYPDSATIQAFGNLFEDSDHHFRYNAMHRPGTVHIYANRFHQPCYNGSGGGKHVHLSPDTRLGSPATVWVYHNSFAGCGWAVDVGAEGARPHLPNVHVLNNLFSATGLTSGPQPSGWHLGQNHTDTLWRSNSVPSFVLPAGHPARDRAPSLVGQLPGMTTAYIGDGQPDYGALQAGRLPETPETPNVPDTPTDIPPTPRNLRLYQPE